MSIVNLVYHIQYLQYIYSVYHTHTYNVYIEFIVSHTVSTVHLFSLPYIRIQFTIYIHVVYQHIRDMYHMKPNFQKVSSTVI